MINYSHYVLIYSLVMWWNQPLYGLCSPMMYLPNDKYDK